MWKSPRGKTNTIKLGNKQQNTLKGESNHGR
jgi:hypothetical protein